MKKLFNPLWLLLSVTIPQGIFLLLYIRSYLLIESLLSDLSGLYWTIFGIAQLIINTGFTIYAILSHKRKTRVHLSIPFFILLIYTLYIYLLIGNERLLFPSSVPRWITSSNELIIYLFMFTVPLLIYSIVILVACFTPPGKKHTIWKNIVPVIAVPLFWYLAITIGHTLIRFIQTQIISRKTIEYITVIIFITSSIIFFFFLFRLVYLIIRKKTKSWGKLNLLWKIPVACVFPVLGLFLNNGATFFTSDSGIFGDFSHPVYYILALSGGIAICIPRLKNNTINLALFIIRAICSMYILYFALVFLPYLPVSIIFIIFFGAGFLMLTPIILLYLFVRELYNDFNHLRSVYNKKIITATMLGCFTVLPLLTTLSYVYDRVQLHKALDYVYQTDYTVNKSIDPDSVINTIKNLGSYKRADRGTPFGNKKPILTILYKWIVFDNLTLSNEKIREMNAIFGGKPLNRFRNSTVAPGNKHVKIIKADTNTVYNEINGYYESSVDLYIKNFDKWQQEFVTGIRLPLGTFISDYYLYIGNTKKKGLLTERNSALWVYSQIVNRRRDPGILYYTNRDKIIFRVFPFAKHETRRTGLTLIHKRPVTLSIAGQTLRLATPGKSRAPVNSISLNNAVTYIPAQVKKQLPEVRVERPCHFIVDCSPKNTLGADTIKTITKNIIDRYAIDPESATIHECNYTIKQYPYSQWIKNNTHLKREGGFYAEYAIKRILFNAYNKKTVQPHIIIITSNYDNALYITGLANFKTMFPVSQFFFVATNSDTFNICSFYDPRKIMKVTGNPFRIYSVLAWPDTDRPQIYLAKNNNDSLYIDLKKISGNFKSNNKWDTALYQYGLWLTTELLPSTDPTLWRQSIKESMHQRIMIPSTSFIVVENRAQEKALLNKQEKVLKGKKGLDAGNGIKQMSEPPLLIIFVLLAAFIIIRRRYLSKKNHRTFF